MVLQDHPRLNKNTTAITNKRSEIDRPLGAPERLTTLLLLSNQSHELRHLLKSRCCPAIKNGIELRCENTQMTGNKSVDPGWHLARGSW